MTRMLLLIHRQTLTEAEAAELDDLLDDYLQR